MHNIKNSSNVGTSTYGAIRSDIIFGRLEPGAKLKLEALKVRYGVSISTLREMLNRLSSEGFVVAEEQRGFFVSSMSDEDLHEIADLRILVEGRALEMSIENGDTEWEGLIVAAHHKLHRMERHMESGDHSVKEDWKRYDWEFHQALVHSCGSRALLDVHAIIFDKYLRYQMRVMEFRGQIASKEHRQLLDAALDRDKSTALTILRRHIESGVKCSLGIGE